LLPRALKNRLHVRRAGNAGAEPEVLQIGDAWRGCADAALLAEAAQRMIDRIFLIAETLRDFTNLSAGGLWNAGMLAQGERDGRDMIPCFFRHVLQRGTAMRAGIGIWRSAHGVTPKRRW
jgi:hypothetical protein